MKTVDFLDELKREHGLTTDYQLHKFMGWSQSSISRYRNKGERFDEKRCEEVAESLALPLPFVSASIAAERSKRPESRKAWELLAKISKSAAATVLIGLFAFFSCPIDRMEVKNLTSNNIHYAKRRRWSWCWVKTFFLRCSTGITH